MSKYAKLCRLDDTVANKFTYKMTNSILSSVNKHKNLGVISSELKFFKQCTAACFKATKF